MTNSQEQLIEILREIYLTGNESELMKLNEFIIEIENKLYRYLARTN